MSGTKPGGGSARRWGRTEKIALAGVVATLVGALATYAARDDDSTQDRFAADRSALADCVDLLDGVWRFEQSREREPQKAELQNKNVFAGRNFIRVVYDLHGLSVNEGTAKDEAALILQQSIAGPAGNTMEPFFVVSFANIGENGKDGRQVVDVPLTDFTSLPDGPSGYRGGDVLDISKPINRVMARFYREDRPRIEVNDLAACRSS